MSKTKKTIAFTGGGTGGHIQPIVSLIEYAQNHSEIQNNCNKLYRFGEQGGHEEKACAELHGVMFVGIYAGKLRRYATISSLLYTIRDVFFFLFGFFQSLWYLWRMDVDIVFCKGGYVALPVCAAAYLLRKKIVMHESDMRAGLTNRLVAKVAKKRFVGFAGTFSDEIVVGQILSDRLDIEPLPIRDATQVLVMGGSQGAASIFDALLTCLAGAGYDDMHFHVLCGTKNEEYKKLFSSYDCVDTYSFIDQEKLAGIYSICDVSLTRGSVTSLQEQQLFCIKKIIIPLPWTGGDHQFHNAVWYTNAYEDILVEQNEHLVTQLTMFLDKLHSFKKNWQKIDSIELTKAKATIWDHIYSL